MTSTQSARYRARLQAMATRVGATVAGLEEQVRTPTGGESAGGLSNAPIHLADVGSEAYNQELGATLLENEAFLRDEVVAALARIDAGLYGTCARCERSIPHERLDALPYTRHCAPCATRIQSGRSVNLNDGRPDGWLGRPGHEGGAQTGSPRGIVGRDLGGAPDDVHAAGTPGGGTEVGGLAGTNVRSGAPEHVNLEKAAAGEAADPPDEADDAKAETYASLTAGALGRSPAKKRARGGKANPPQPRHPTTRKDPTAATRKKPRKRSG